MENIAQLTQLIKAIENASMELDASNSTFPSQGKQHLLTAAKNLVDALEGPDPGIAKVLFGPQAHASLRAAYDMRIFEVFEDNQYTAHELAEKTGAEKLLVVRIMRAICSLGIFQEIGVEVYAHNSRSKKLMQYPFYCTAVKGLRDMSSYILDLGDYLASISFKNPMDQNLTLFQYTMQTEMSYFDWLHTQPKKLEEFSAMMAAASTANLGDVVNILSTLLPKELHSTADGNTADSVLIVDVGGGRGRILNTLSEKEEPKLKGKMVVQDLPKEIEGREASDGIEGMPHDFFTPQPIKGARIYFFRHIFHDWSDSNCRKILQQTIQAMEKGYSKLVIVDAIVPDTGASVYQTMADISMITLSGMERTERHWRELLEGEGLKIMNIRGDNRNQGIIEEGTIEAMLA